MFELREKLSRFSFGWFNTIDDAKSFFMNRFKGKRTYFIFIECFDRENDIIFDVNQNGDFKKQIKTFA